MRRKVDGARGDGHPCRTKRRHVVCVHCGNVDDFTLADVFRRRLHAGVLAQVGSARRAVQEARSRRHICGDANRLRHSVIHAVIRSYRHPKSAGEVHGQRAVRRNKGVVLRRQATDDRPNRIETGGKRRAHSHRRRSLQVGVAYGTADPRRRRSFTIDKAGIDDRRCRRGK
ncbi:hypothetical protein SDC9_163636 [bioreactor metagenome]|uniref:Uncharacterized protein n=1 Tax=bioreactor metagenome TaxID=1076179 RepID=A0A645FPE0_9ZZZZ